MNKITPFLWYDDQAVEAMNFYCSIFPNSKPGEVEPYGEDFAPPFGKITSVTFEIEGQTLTAFNGGPYYKFTPAVSLSVDCQTQEEVDELWEKFTADGGEELQCGWLTDKFGVTWQIVPSILPKLIQDPDTEKAGKVMQAMLGMKKLDIAALKAAYDS